MTNVPVHPIVTWNTGVMEELNSIVLWIQYQDEPVKAVDDMPWSPVFLLSAEKAKGLIADLQKQLERLEG